jgi:hypothetical protein
MMPRFVIDCRKGQVVLQQPPKLTNEQIVKRVKEVHYRLVAAHKITDEELKTLVQKIMTGTRNLHYLTTPENHRRLTDVATYIIREFSY